VMLYVVLDWPLKVSDEKEANPCTEPTLFPVRFLTLSAGLMVAVTTKLGKRTGGLSDVERQKRSQQP
jgi:hypothetical protein